MKRVRDFWCRISLFSARAIFCAKPLYGNIQEILSGIISGRNCSVKSYPLLGFFMRSDLDVMPVRADEQFNYQAMQTYIHTHVVHAEGPLEVRQFGGGHANLTYLLRMG